MNQIIEKNKANISSVNNEFVQSKQLPVVKTDLTSDILETRFNMARKTGRDINEVMKKCNEIFQNTGIAKYYIESLKSIYKVPRKNNKTNEIIYIKGLTINVIKDLANIYSHLAYGVDYFVQGHKVRAKAYCVDIYNNISEERFFELHFPNNIIQLINKGKTNAPDEIYKYVYQNGIRRMRVCIEHILPLWLVERVFKLIDSKKIEFYNNKMNREKNFKEIFDGFKKINSKIQTLNDLSKFLNIEITKEKLNDPKFFTHLEEIYIGYRDEKVPVKDDNINEEKKTRMTNKNYKNETEKYNQVMENLKA